MMSDKQISQDEVNQLIEDAAYLQDEADALQYVIEEVPYDQSPPDQPSIAEMLLLVDHAQTSYYRPVFEETLSSDRPTHLDDFTHFEENFSLDDEEVDIQKILRKISKHRAGVVNLLEDTSLIDWEEVVYDEGEQLSLFNFIKQMIYFERDMLKKIVTRVRIFSQEKQTQRDLEQRQEQRQPFNGDSNS